MLPSVRYILLIYLYALTVAIIHHSPFTSRLTMSLCSFNRADAVWQCSRMTAVTIQHNTEWKSETKREKKNWMKIKYNSFFTCDTRSSPSPLTHTHAEAMNVQIKLFARLCVRVYVLLSECVRCATSNSQYSIYSIHIDWIHSLFSLFLVPLSLPPSASVHERTDPEQKARVNSQFKMSFEWNINQTTSNTLEKKRREENK